MDEQKRPRAWVYARIPGDYDGTMNSYKVCSMQALHDGCDIVGGSIDERGGWLLRPGYRDMLRQIKAGKVDRFTSAVCVRSAARSATCTLFSSGLCSMGYRSRPPSTACVTGLICFGWLVVSNVMRPEKVCGCRGDCQRAAYCAYGTVRASTAFGVPNAHLLGESP